MSEQFIADKILQDFIAQRDKVLQQFQATYNKICENNPASAVYFVFKEIVTNMETEYPVLKDVFEDTCKKLAELKLREKA